MLAINASFLYARQDHLDRDPRPLGPESGFVISFVDKRTSGTDCISAKDAFILLACDGTRLSTFSVNETNARSARALWSCRPRRSGRTRRSRLAFFALFSFHGGLVFTAGRKSHC